LLNLRDRAGEVVGLGEFGRRGIKDLQSVMQKAFCNSIGTFRTQLARADDVSSLGGLKQTLRLRASRSDF